MAVIEMGGDDKVVAKSKGVAAKYFLSLSNEAVQKENYKEAAMMATKSIGYDYENPVAYYVQALSYNNFSSYAEAIKAVEGGLKAAGGDDSNLYFELGRAYEGKGDTQKACEAYGKVTDGPNVDAAIYQRSTVLNCN